MTKPRHWREPGRVRTPWAAWRTALRPASSARPWACRRAVMPPALRRVAGLVDDRLAVRVDAAAPVVLVKLKIAVLGRLERRRGLDGTQLQVEAGLGRHRLQDFADGAYLRAVGQHE